jgi:glutamate synthase domain-containing protein 2
MRACNTDNCPVGIATQKQHLRSRLIVEESARQLAQFFEASAHLMSVLARACGHHSLTAFTADDLTTFDREMAHLTGIHYGGVSL